MDYQNNARQHCCRKTDKTNIDISTNEVRVEWAQIKTSLAPNLMKWNFISTEYELYSKAKHNKNNLYLFWKNKSEIFFQMKYRNCNPWSFLSNGMLKSCNIFYHSYEYPGESTKTSWAYIHMHLCLGKKI